MKVGDKVYCIVDKNLGGKQIITPGIYTIFLIVGDDDDLIIQVCGIDWFFFEKDFISLNEYRKRKLKKIDNYYERH